MRSKKAQTIIRTVVLVVISLVIGIGIYNWNATKISGNAMPMPFGVGVGVVLSGSMEPEINIDDVIVVGKTDYEDYKLGDVVVYQEGRMLVVHEIIEISEDRKTLTTKGYANTGPDEPIKVEYVKGRVVKVFPRLGKLVNVIKTPAVSYVIAIIAVILLALSYRKERKEAETYDEAIDRIKNEISRLKNEQNNSK
jgi:signal peptidase